MWKCSIRRSKWLVIAAAPACGCDRVRGPSPLAPSRSTAFSAIKAGDVLPREWGPWTMSRFRPSSRYRLVEDAGATVLQGSARASASGLIHYLDVDPLERPLLFWRWKVMALAPTDASPDDSPARIVVSFAGDVRKLPFGDRLFYDQFRLFTGQQLPYAALMYVWGSRTPRDGVVANGYTSRIKIIAVENGRENLGKWLDETRDVAAGLRAPFGEEPGKVISVGIMTEADASDRALEAYYGDLEFREAKGR